MKRSAQTLSPIAATIQKAPPGTWELPRRLRFDAGLKIVLDGDTGAGANRSVLTFTTGQPVSP